MMSADPHGMDRRFVRDPHVTDPGLAARHVADRLTRARFRLAGNPNCKHARFEMDAAEAAADELKRVAS